MPRYLRWIAAITSGVTAQFAYFILVGAIAVGVGEKDTAGDVSLGGSAGLLITFGGFLFSIIPALGVNDWLAKRYPLEAKKPAERVDA